jgi:SAM-dependent methyltransferase
MITSPLEMRAVINDLAGAAWSLAAIGILFESSLGDQLIEPRTLDELAAATSIRPARIEKLLALAAAHGVVVADGARYRLADGVVPVVCGPMRATMLGEIRSSLLQPLAMLTSPSSPAWSHTDPAVLEAQGQASSVLPAMIKTQIAPALGDLSARLTRPGAKFLDIGTGVGALAIAACRVFPEMHVVGLDHAEAPLAIARAKAATAGVGDRLELRRGSVHEMRDEAAYACAWLPAFFIAADTLPAAITRVVAALEPGGWLLVGIPGAGDPKQRAITELVADAWGGPSMTTAAAEAMLREAGLHDVRTLPGPAWAPQMLAGRRA